MRTRVFETKKTTVYSALLTVENLRRLTSQTYLVMLEWFEFGCIHNFKWPKIYSNCHQLPYHDSNSHLSCTVSGIRQDMKPQDIKEHDMKLALRCAKRLRPN